MTIKTFKIYTGILKSISGNDFEGDWVKSEDFKEAIKITEEILHKRVLDIIDKFIEEDKELCKNSEDLFRKFYLIDKFSEIKQEIENSEGKNDR